MTPNKVHSITAILVETNGENGTKYQIFVEDMESNEYIPLQEVSEQIAKRI